MTFILCLAGIVMILLSGIFRGIVFLDAFDNDPEVFFTMIEIFSAIGLACLSIGLLLGALMREELSDTLRTGLLIAAGIIIGFWATGGFISFPWYL
jgi:galactitol-specific phosphotransferase system IIC component